MCCRYIHHDAKTLPARQLTISGRDYTVKLIPIPVTDCDHRYESAGYRPGALLRHLVEVRDGQCTQPTCVRAARRCDFEHATPWDKGGRTCGCNGGCRCRRDHRVKQSPGWKVTQPMPGYHQWTTPSGRTYTGDRIEVSVRLDDGQAVIAVTDSGCGIPPTDLDRIFGRFSRAEPYRSREASGFGLGLPIVQAIAEAHDGSVRVHSASGHGATFELVIPAVPELTPLKGDGPRISGPAVRAEFRDVADVVP